MKLLPHSKDCLQFKAHESIFERSLVLNLVFLCPYYQLKTNSTSKLTQCPQLSWFGGRKEVVPNDLMLVTVVPCFHIFLMGIKNIMKIILIVLHFGHKRNEGTHF